MRVEVITVGDELLQGRVVNTNATSIALRLTQAGFENSRQVVVGDDREVISRSVADALRRSDAVIVTGGLGPTPDDLTREALADLAGVELVRDPEWVNRLIERARLLGRSTNPAMLRMADRPATAKPVPNRTGAAPGLEMEIGSKPVFALPGVPSELVTMLDEEVMPRLERRLAGRVAVVRILRVWGMWESEVADVLADLWGEGVRAAFQISDGEVQVRIAVSGLDPQEAAARADRIAAEASRRLGESVFATDDQKVEDMVASLLVERGWRVAIGEDLTAGSVANRLFSAHPEVLAAGVIRRTEVSPLAEAEELRRQVGAEVTLWVGSGRNTDRGTTRVELGMVTPEGQLTDTFEYHGGPATVRAAAVAAALHTLRRVLSSG